MAANEVDDIVQNVVLTGNEEVIEAFAKIEEAGRKAFETIEHAAENALSFSGIAEIIGGLAASVAIATVGMFEFTRRTSESIETLNNLAEQTGTTTEAISGLTAAFASNGVSSGELQNSFRRLAVVVNTTWTEIKQASAVAADQQKRDALSIESAYLAVGKASRTLADVEKENSISRQASVDSVRGAELNLQSARLSVRSANGEDVSDQEKTLQLAKSRLAVEEAELNLERQQIAARNAEAEAVDKAKQASIAKQTADLNFAAAQRKAAEDAANNINNVTHAVEELAKGNTHALDSINASALNLTKGIVAAAGGGTEALSKLSGTISDFSKPAPQAEAVLLKLSEVMSHLENGAQKTALASAFFGRSVSENMIEVLSQGPEAFKAFQDRLEKLGLAVTEVDVSVAQKFHKSLTQLVTDIQFVAEKLNTALGPGFTTILNSIDAALIKNKDSFLAFGQTIVQEVVPFVEGLIRVLEGVPQDSDKWINDYVQSLFAFGRALVDITVTVAKVTLFIIASFEDVAKQINDLFGTHITGFEIFLTALVLSTQTAMRLIIVAISAVPIAFEFVKDAVVGVMSGMATATAEAGASMSAVIAGLVFRFGLIGVAAFTAYKSVIAFMDAIGAGGRTPQFSEMLDSAKQRLQALANAKDWPDLQKRWTEIGDNQKKVEDEMNKRDDDRLAKQNANSGSFAEEYKKNLEKLLKDNEDAANKILEPHKSAADNIKKAYADMSTGVKSSLDEIAKAKPPTSNLPPRLETPEVRKALGLPEPTNNLPPGQTTVSLPPGSAALPPPVQPEALSDKFASSLELVTRSTQDYVDAMNKAKADIAKPIAPAPEAANAGPSFFEKLSTVLDNILSKGTLNPPPVGGVSPEVTTAPVQQPDPTLFERLSASVSSFMDTLTTNAEKLNGTATAPAVNSENIQNLGVRSEAVDQSLTQVASSGTSAATSLDSLVAAAASAANALSNISAPSTPPPTTVTAAAGGHIVGPGGPTSDSIPAWLSNGEFVHTARATSFWGLDFMRAINNLQVPRFNMGGLAGLLSPSLPRFAGGGVVSAAGAGAGGGFMAVDLRTDHGSVTVQASPAAALQLQRLAVTKRITATGRKPGFVS